MTLHRGEEGEGGGRVRIEVAVEMLGVETEEIAVTAESIGDTLIPAPRPLML